MFEGKRILITGGTGFIGSKLAAELLRLGADVHITSRKADGGWRIEEIRSKVTIHESSLTDGPEVMALVQKIQPNYIFHLASSTNRKNDLALYEEQYGIHVQSSLNLIRAATALPSFVRLIHTGTNEEYGRGPSPYQESQREDPVQPYSLTKIMGTHLVQFAAKELHFPAVIVRLSLTYGPCQGPGMFITGLIKSCIEGKDFDMTPGEQTRDFNYVDDAVQGLILAATTPSIEGEIFNIGSGREIQVREMAERIYAYMKPRMKLNVGAVPYRPGGELMHCWLDITKARERLGYLPKTPLEDGLQKTLDWYNAHAHETRIWE